MNEAPWGGCNDPVQLWKCLRGVPSQRKLRLWACSCVRQGVAFPPDEMDLAAAQAAEGFADGAADRFVLIQGYRKASHTGAHWASEEDAERGARLWAGWTLPTAEATGKRAGLFRCVFGNSYHPLSVDPGWLTWNGGVVQRLAEAAYQEPALQAGQLDSGRLAIMADALEESGCAAQALLEHLRSPGPHVRGCWAVDLLTGRG